MSINEVLLAKCELCAADNLTITPVFKRLQRKLKGLLAQGVKLSEQQETVGSGNEGFLQLLRVLAVRRELTSKPPPCCIHLRLFKLLQKALSCTPATLDYLCQLTASCIAERNYTLALLEAQIKHAADRLAIEPMPLVKEQPKFTSLHTLPSVGEIKERQEGQAGSSNLGAALIGSFTSLQEGEFMTFPFFCGVPFLLNRH